MHPFPRPAVAALLLAVTGCEERKQAPAQTSPPAATHPYRVDVQGTAGTRVRMLLVSKASEAAPPDRREEVLTVPAQIDVKAVRCYAWFDSVPEAGSPNGGGVTVRLLKDGKPAGTLEMTIRSSGKQGGGLGDL
jgi:hypothetical protein